MRESYAYRYELSDSTPSQYRCKYLHFVDEMLFGEVYVDEKPKTKIIWPLQVKSTYLSLQY